MIKEEVIEEKISDTIELKEKLKEENSLLEAEIERQEILKGKLAIAGRSVLIPPAVPETPDEKWAREAKIRYKGTGMDPTI